MSRKSFYDQELDRLEWFLQQETPGTDEYKAILDDIDRLQSQEDKHKNIKRRVPIDLKKPIVGGSILAGLFGWNHFLNDHGDMLSGQFKQNSESLTNSAIRIFSGFKFW